MTPLEHAIQTINQNLVTDDGLIAAKCRALMAGYDARYRDAAYVPLAIEKIYESPLTNPDTQRTARVFSIAGKIDVLAQYQNRTVLIDHKTTSQDIADPASAYWRQLIVEGQVSHYMLLLWQSGIKCDEAMWDVMRKPSISPKKLTKAEVRAVASLREYFGRKVEQDAADACVQTERETVEMYEARLAWDCTRERPDHYFQRRPVPRLDSDLLDYARELWEHSLEMLHTRREQRYPRNSGACLLYGAPCKYLGICSGYDTPDSDRWVKRSQVHRELDGLSSDGKNVLTNSRIRCFQTCRRKHYYDYELGLERLDEEEREALVFGTLWHRALETWWSCFLQQTE